MTGCPECESENVYSIESIRGSCVIEFFENPEDGGEPSIEFCGYTEMFWDSTQTIAIECGECGWRHDFDENHSPNIKQIYEIIKEARNDRDSN